VSEEVKERLRALKRDEESFDDLLDRLSRREKDLEEIAGCLAFADQDGTLEQRMDEAHEELSESLDGRVER
jgi:predicted CopG family antitoxin